MDGMQKIKKFLRFDREYVKGPSKLIKFCLSPAGLYAGYGWTKGMEKIV